MFKNLIYDILAAYASIILKNMGISKPLGYNNSHHFNGYSNGMLTNRGNTDTMNNRRHQNGLVKRWNGTGIIQ